MANNNLENIRTTLSNIGNNERVFDSILEFYPQLRYKKMTNSYDALSKLEVLLDNNATEDYIFKFATDHQDLPDFVNRFSRFVVSKDTSELKFTNLLLRARNSTPSFPFTEWTASTVVEKNNLPLLQWLRAQDPPCPWNANVTNTAATKGFLEILDWSYSEGCPLSKGVCSEAASNGHLDCLQYGYNHRENSVSSITRNPSPMTWNTYVCRYAAQNGHLDCLQFVRSCDTPCPWNYETIKYAALNARYDCMVWARENGCPYLPICDTINNFLWEYEQSGIAMARYRQQEDLYTEQDRIRCRNYIFELCEIPPPNDNANQQDGGNNTSTNISNIILGSFILFSAFMQSL